MSQDYQVNTKEIEERVEKELLSHIPLDFLEKESDNKLPEISTEHLIVSYPPKPDENKRILGPTKKHPDRNSAFRKVWSFNYGFGGIIYEFVQPEEKGGTGNLITICKFKHLQEEVMFVNNKLTDNDVNKNLFRFPEERDVIRRLQSLLYNDLVIELNPGDEVLFMQSKTSFWEKGILKEIVKHGYRIEGKSIGYIAYKCVKYKPEFEKFIGTTIDINELEQFNKELNLLDKEQQDNINNQLDRLEKLRLEVKLLKKIGKEIANQERKIEIANQRGITKDKINILQNKPKRFNNKDNQSFGKQKHLFNK